MKVHEQEMTSPLFDNVENLKPVINKEHQTQQLR